MKSVTIVILILFLSAQVCLAQNTPVNNPMSKVTVISLGAGISMGQTDYASQKTDYLAKGSIEYFFPSTTRGNLGIGIYGGVGKIGGTDARFTSFTTDIDYIGIEASYILQVSNVVYPYVSVGWSSLWYFPKDYNGNRMDVPGNNQQGAYNGEIGIKFMATNSLSLNLAGGVLLGSNDYFDAVKIGSHNDGGASVTAGLSFYFGRNKDSDNDGVPDYLDQCPGTPAGVKVDAFGCPLDADGDGVPDYIDKCANTPRGITVDAIGCPLDADKDGVPDYMDKCPNTPYGVSVDANGCPLDADGDGVPDYLDKCPNTPKGVQVNRAGCPIDSDGDGVPDYLDKCPNTPKGTLVDASGCPIVKAPVIKKLILRGDANFESGKSELLLEAYPVLDNLVTSMKDNPNQKWVIVGYTDSKGSNSLNLNFPVTEQNL